MSSHAGMTVDRDLERRDWKAALSREEIAGLLELEDWRSWASIATNWGLVLAAFALVALAPNAASVILALFVIGGRQLGFAVLMHEASHRTLLRSRRWNDLVGNWLCAYPIWSDLEPYRAYHLQHHARTWTEGDPDIGLALPFPVTRRSMLRKVWRDLSGRTGWKRAVAVLRRDLGISSGKTARKSGAGWRAFEGVAITNGILLGAVALVGHPELYLLWIGAWFTTYSLAMRVRAIAEHSMVEDRDDPLKHTRTTVARWWERLLLAPNRVNFHLEHHLLMTVPHYKLPRMHRLLRERGVLDGAEVVRGYPEVLRRASSSPAAS